jgi:hypothetical protein
MPSSISSEVLILLIFLKVATLGFGNFFFVRALMTFLVCDPETLIIATPEIPGPEESAKIVINYYYNLVIIQII